MVFICIQQLRDWKRLSMTAFGRNVKGVAPQFRRTLWLCGCRNSLGDQIDVETLARVFRILRWLN